MPNRRRNDIDNDWEAVLDDKLSSLASKDNIKELKDLILAQNAEIQALRKRVDKQDELILKQDDLVSKLNDKIGVLTGAIETIKKGQDDQEQFSRRYCLRISGIKQDQNETADNCVNKVLKQGGHSENQDKFQDFSRTFFCFSRTFEDDA